MEVTLDPRELVADLEDEPGLRLEPDADLSRLTTFRIGGPADLLVEATDEAALVRLLRHLEARGESPQLLGLGSNLLFPDEGLRGVVLRLTGDFRKVRIVGQRVVAGAAVTLARIARRTAAAGLGGLEPLSGVPSTVGGAVVMNAGCYGAEIRDVLTAVRVCDRGGRVRTMTVEELDPGYRSTVLQRTGDLVLEATFELTSADPEACRRRIDELNRKRWQSLPSGHPNVGSIFRNPPGDPAGRLIDQCGLRGRRRGDAQISSKHANVIVNLGGARAADVLALMAEARRAVESRFGVSLEPEVILTGSLAAEWRRLTAV